jgi:multidrug efflux pump subunit AcrA (membrane-fusion protein)
MNVTNNTDPIRRGAALSGLLLALILLFPVFSGCERIKEVYGGKNAAGSAANAEAPVFAVNTAAAEQGQIRDYIILSGDIIAGSTVDTYSDAAGKVTRVYVAAGDRVNRGENIAAVDPSRPGLDYRVSVVKAPITGIVVAVPAQVGMTISQSVPLARIASGNALEIRLYVAERFISRIAMNLPCEITLDAWPGEVFKGSIKEISPTLDPASRTMEIRVNVDNPGLKLKAGMFAKVRVIIEEKQGVVKIPASAVVSRFGENYVFAVESGGPGASAWIVRKKAVVPGILIDNMLEIQQGLLPDEEIVIRGQTLLEDGSRINIIDRTPSLGAN